MANMKKVKAAVGQDDLFSGCAPLLDALCKLLRRMDLV